MFACLNRGDYNYEKGDGTWKYTTGETEIVGTGTEFPLGRDNTGWENQPQGWRTRAGLDRGHLLARSLGGDGIDLRNLVPLYARVNRYEMAPYEEALDKRIQSGETIWHQVIAHYSGSNKIPDHLTLRWSGNRTGAGGVKILNTR